MDEISLEIKKKVSKWIDLAEEDLRLAKFALTMSTSCPFRLIAYHAQQCAEKYLKAFLVFHQKDFPYTHSITRLLELCDEIPSFKFDLSDTEILSAYAVASRYPSEYDEITKEESEKAILLAEKVKESIAKYIQPPIRSNQQESK